MAKRFNAAGLCVPDKHDMVDLGERLAAVRKMIEEGDYFTINRAGTARRRCCMHWQKNWRASMLLCG